MNINEVKKAISEAEDVIKTAEKAAASMCSIILPRLHTLPQWQLRDLKRRLSNYNMKTGEWK